MNSKKKRKILFAKNADSANFIKINAYSALISAKINDIIISLRIGLLSFFKGFIFFAEAFGYKI